MNLHVAVNPVVTISLIANGVELKEYDDPESMHDAASKITKYVETVPDATFVIRCSVNFLASSLAPQDRVSFCVFFDGKGATSSWTHDRKGSRGGRASVDIAAVKRLSESGWVREEFKFTKLNTNDGPTQGFEAANFKQLGEIEVRALCVRKGPLKPDTSQHIKERNEVDQTLPEKCLKGRAISNRVSLGEPTVMVPRNYYARLYPYGKEPFATYVFKYRSHSDLRMDGIIPRTPTPVPLEERDPDDLTLEEARELLRRKLAKEDEAKVKQENAIEIKQEKKREYASLLDDDDDDDDGDSVEIIQTIDKASKRARLSPDSGVELVDLTDD